MNTKDKDCIFCKIIAGEIPSQNVYKDNEVVAFKDINPSAPIHIMVVPAKHIVSLATITEKEMPLISKMTAAAIKIAGDFGLTEKGYRLIINSGPDGGQVVQHLHMHLLGGRVLKWEQ